MRAKTILLAALAFALPSAPRTPAFAADKAAADKAAADKAAADKAAAADPKRPKSVKERAAEKRAQIEKDKAEKEDKAKACSPTCTPTCDCEGKPITPAKCSPTCTPTCDCDGKPITPATDTKKAAGDTKSPEDSTKKAADDPKKKADDDAKKKADDDAKKKADDAKKAAEEQKAAEAKSVGPIEALRKDRPDRRKQSADRLRRRWGVALTAPKAQDELKLHARRVALLQRIRAAAEAKKDTKTVEAVDELLTKEDDRNSQAMNALREGALPAVTP